MYEHIRLLAFAPIQTLKSSQEQKSLYIEFWFLGTRRIKFRQKLFRPNFFILGAANQDTS